MGREPAEGPRRVCRPRPLGDEVAGIRRDDDSYRWHPQFCRPLHSAPKSVDYFVRSSAASPRRHPQPLPRRSAAEQHHARDSTPGRGRSRGRGTRSRQGRVCGHRADGPGRIRKRNVASKDRADAQWPRASYATVGVMERYERSAYHRTRGRPATAASRLLSHSRGYPNRCRCRRESEARTIAGASQRCKAYCEGLWRTWLDASRRCGQTQLPRTTNEARSALDRIASVDLAETIANDCRREIRGFDS